MTAAARTAMLSAYRDGEPVREICRRFGVASSTLAYHRARAGLPKRQDRPRLTPEQRAAREERRRLRSPVELPFEQSPLLPVYPVRLVSRPGEGASQHWICSCGQRVHDDFIFCPACLTDRPGYSTTRGGDDGRS